MDGGISQGGRTIVKYVICLGAFLSNLSAGMFNIALVDIADEFGIRVSLAQWVVTVYLLAISICLPLMGRLGDRMGRRKVHNTGYFIFMLAAILSACAPSLGWLVSFRVLQGFGAAMYQATNMALIVSLFPREQRGRALGLMSTFVAAGSMIGPGLGGILIQWFSWRVNFWLLGAVAGAAWFLAQRFIPRDTPQGNAGLDLPGAALFAVGLTGLVTAVSMGGTWGWASLPVVLFVLLFAATTFGFILWSSPARWEKRGGDGKEPFIKLDVFRDSGVKAGILITISTYMAAFSAQLVLPVFLRNELGIAPAVAGLMMMSYPLSLIVSAPFFGGRSDKVGGLPILSVGLLVMTGTLTAFGFLSADFPELLLIALVILLGGSMGMITSPNNSLVMNRTAKEHLGFISSILALSRNLGMMFGTAVGGAMLHLTGTAAHGSGLASEVTGYRLVFGISAVLIVIALLFMRITARRGRLKESLSS
ncbi:MFS transporter [Gorillibacterium massiliense]|uniref:MFS transporter n=1 Tax=Gorillibacterium massiliense TaxID=1280390 RepID=UPI0004B738C0|nr:MFS transporter [Gorillibacterium massiliense]